MKKFLIFFLVFSLFFFVSACSKGGGGSEVSVSNSGSSGSGSGGSSGGEGGGSGGNGGSGGGGTQPPEQPPEEEEKYLRVEVTVVREATGSAPNGEVEICISEVGCRTQTCDGVSFCRVVFEKEWKWNEDCRTFTATASWEAETGSETFQTCKMTKAGPPDSVVVWIQ